VAASAIALGIVGYVAYDSLWLPFYRRLVAAQSVARRLSPIHRQYLAATGSLARLGIPRGLSETPYEYADRALPLLDRAEANLGVQIPTRTFSELTARFVSDFYAGETTEPMGPAVEEFQAAVGAAVRKRFLMTVRRWTTRGHGPASAHA
jgi:hypothetical protein